MQHATGDVNAVIMLSGLRKIEHTARSARFRVMCTEDQTFDTRVYHGPYTHRAWFQGYI